MDQKKLPNGFLEEDMNHIYYWSTNYIFQIKMKPEFDIMTEFDRIDQAIKQIPSNKNEIELRKNYQLLDKIIFW